ncbi:hypothetical protein [Microbacterium sp. P02]|uniref:hypothetical protein n=1 Tax=Microbacterium sp. P02 TaxID=3366260 RepID=UPI003670FB4A
MSAPPLPSRAGGSGPSSAASAVARPAADAPPRASVLPLVVGGAAVVASIVLAIIVATSASATVVMLGLPLPLVAADHWSLSLLGYLLTPVAVIACYGWDAVGQRRGRARNRNFVLRPGYSRALTGAAGLGVLLGAWHVLNLSVPLSELLGWS